MFYEIHYAHFVENQNARNAKIRHTERNRTIEDLLAGKKTCPEETIYQFGTLDEHASVEDLVLVVTEFMSEFHERFGTHVHLLDWALHLDESTPHIHERHVFDCENKYGEIAPQQEKALEALGFDLPDPDKPLSRRNNRKITFDAACRKMLFEIAKRHGLELEEEAEYGSRKYLEKQDFILAKQKEQLTAQQNKLDELTLKVSDMETLLEDVSAAAYDKAVEVVTDVVRTETRKEDMRMIVFLLAVVLFGLLFVSHRQEQRQTAYMQQLQKEAMPYEQEINEIRSELARKQRAINTKEDASGILFGFVPASVDDFTEIDKLAAEHSITPVIFLDCSQEKEQLTRILKKAVAEGYEVVLAGLQFDESILQTADEMKDLLVQIDDTKSPAFLLRNKVNTEENRNLLNEHGYTELILYDASLQAGMQENGKPYICYGFFKQPAYYADYISQVVTAHTMMLASFDFSTIQSGTLQISDVERFMTLTDDRKAANELRYVDLNSAFQAVADQNATRQERQESYEKYEAEQEKRIQELEEEISAIYSRWDEY